MTSTELNKANGFFGEFGGSYIPEELQRAMDQIEEAFLRYKDDPEFLKEYDYYLKEYVGRENPLTYAENLTNQMGGAKIYLKREDLTIQVLIRLTMCWGRFY